MQLFEQTLHGEVQPRAIPAWAQGYEVFLLADEFGFAEDKRLGVVDIFFDAHVVPVRGAVKGHEFLGPDEELVCGGIRRYGYYSGE